MLRELLDVDLLDVTITANPAYPETEVARRALEQAGAPFRATLARRYLEVLEAY
jgi:phage head maturation protease